MKNVIKNMVCYACMALALCVVTSCEDTDALESDIDSLNDRVTALENKVKMLNDNMAALHILLQEGVIITSVENSDGVYTLTLSDGSVLKLAEKTEGFGNAPLVSIDTDGNWQVSYDNGQTFTSLGVAAIGEDGITPLFRVSSDGYWEISYDEGATYERVKDEEGNDVKAVYDATSGDQVFTSAEVSEDGSFLELTLGDGETTVSIPIVPDFYCYFDESITGEQRFDDGETRTFNLHINGAEQTLVTAPTGWHASLGEADASTNIAVLTVTAPASASTRATADNTRDISVLALKGGFAIIAKLQVTNGEAEALTSFTLPITASVTFTELANYSTSTALSGRNDFWFHREHTDNTSAGVGTTLSVASDEIQAARGALVRNGWNNSSFGYHCASPFEMGVYRLTFEAMSSDGGSIASAIRNSTDTKGFLIVNADGTSRDRTVHPQSVESTWTEYTIYFDFSQSSTGMRSTNLEVNDGISASDASDVEQINFYFYNNTQNTTVSIRNIRIEKQ